MKLHATVTDSEARGYYGHFSQVLTLANKRRHEFRVIFLDSPPMVPQIGDTIDLTTETGPDGALLAYAWE